MQKRKFLIFYVEHIFQFSKSQKWVEMQMNIGDN